MQGSLSTTIRWREDSVNETIRILCFKVFTNGLTYSAAISDADSTSCYSCIVAEGKLSRHVQEGQPQQYGTPNATREVATENTVRKKASQDD